MCSAISEEDANAGQRTVPCCKSSKSRSDRARVGGHEQTRRARQTDEKRRTLGEILAGPLAWDHLLDNRAWPGNLVAYLLPARYAERPRAGLFVAATPAMSPSEPPTKRTVVVIDGQNLFRGAREALGYISPTIARRPCDGRG